MQDIAAAPPTLPQPGSYPVRLQIRRPEQQRWLTNLPLGIGTGIRLLLLLPSIVLLMLYITVLAPVLYLAASVVILCRGRYPVGMYRQMVGIMRWSANSAAYFFHLYDEYPPLDLEARPETRLQFTVEYPHRPSRWLNAPALGLTIKLVLCIPHFIALTVLHFLAASIVFIASFALIVDHQFPAGLFEMVTGILRWGLRVHGYLVGLTDRYPPFSLS